LPVGAALAQGTNTTLKLGNSLFLKIYRRLTAGVNPELEIGRFLTEVAHFPHVVPLAGAVEYDSPDNVSSVLALLQAFIPNQGDGWDYPLNYLARFIEDRRTGTALPADAHGAYFALVRILAVRTAELHGALASATNDPAFAPEPIAPEDLKNWC